MAYMSESHVEDPKRRHHDNYAYSSVDTGNHINTAAYTCAYVVHPHLV